ncbi:ubiquinone biosynthesis protein UbiA [Amycolatopsis antarctica]|uniref:Ubiquinone biosynthesis protein UbiA n=1 Tax=Amycolatopsis antarctica TaxID=1854586 RepID=A0A263D2A3_9PSEU|nr:ubiquinone biosynthesis protein UbiA [Amycolatopsis antarctica]
MQTWRPYTLAYPALIGVAGAALAGAANRPGLLVLAAVVPALGWLSGHYLGDWFDRGLDAIEKPQRPIPSGRLSQDAALACGILCALTSAILATAANWRILPVFVVTIAGVIGYSAVFKARGLAGNLVRGALTALALVIGAMLTGGTPPWVLLPVALAFLLHDAASNLVGAIRDVDGDRQGGYASVPVLRGVPHAVRTALGLYLLAVAVLGTAAAGAPDPGAQLGLTAAAALAGAAAFRVLARHVTELTRPRALRAHEILVAERLVLTCSVIAGAAGRWLALGLLVPALAVSLAAQAAMRSRHEFATPMTLEKRA